MLYGVKYIDPVSLVPFAGRGQGQGQKRANVLLGIPGLGIKSSQVPTVSSIAPGSSKDGKDSSDPGKGMGHFPDRSDSNDDTYVDKIACDPCLVFGVVSPTYNTPKPRRPCVAWWADRSLGVRSVCARYATLVLHEGSDSSTCV